MRDRLFIAAIGLWAEGKGEGWLMVGKAGLMNVDSRILITAIGERSGGGQVEGQLGL